MRRTRFLKCTGASLVMRMPLLAVFIAGTAFGQQNEPKAVPPTETAKSGMMSGNMDMMAMHAKMMADMKANDASLDLKVKAMNEAKGQAKVNATAAVINEMVTQQKQMMTKMMSMHDQMMKGMKTMDSTSPNPHKDHHE